MALVLNPGTGHVSPQYHLVFDDEFSTARHLRAGTVPQNWRELVESSSFSSTEEQYSLADTWLNQNALHPDDPDSAPLNSASLSPPPPSVSDVEISAPAPSPSVSGGASSGTSSAESPSFVSEEEVSRLVSEGATSPAPSQVPACGGDDLKMPEFVNLETAGLRHLARIKKQKKKRLSQFNFFNYFGGSNLYVHLSKHQKSMDSITSPAGQFFFTLSVAYMNYLNMHFDGTFNIFSTLAYAALNDLNDVYTYREMLKQPDVSKFVEAMIKEVMDHEERRHWICVPRSKIPKGASTILGIWSFKRKRLPSGEIMLSWRYATMGH